MDQVIEMLFNNGIGIAVIAYFMIRDYKFMDNLTKIVASLNASLEQIQNLISDLRGDDHDEETN